MPFEKRSKNEVRVKLTLFNLIQLVHRNEFWSLGFCNRTRISKFNILNMGMIMSPY